MDVDFGRAVYVGGNPAAPTTEQVPGFLAVTDNGFRFDVVGEYREELWRVAWPDIRAWDAEGPNEATKAAGTGRMVVGALALGVVGALLASATRSSQYSTVLVLSLGDSEVVFLLLDVSPPSAIAQLQQLPAARARRGRPDTHASGRNEFVPWEHRVTDLATIDALGADGWEAVGVWVDGGLTKVLCKRPGRGVPGSAAGITSGSAQLGWPPPS